MLGWIGGIAMAIPWADGSDLAAWRSVAADGMAPAACAAFLVEYAESPLAERAYACLVEQGAALPEPSAPRVRRAIASVAESYARHRRDLGRHPEVVARAHVAADGEADTASLAPLTLSVEGAGVVDGTSTGMSLGCAAHLGPGSAHLRLGAVDAPFAEVALRGTAWVPVRLSGSTGLRTVFVEGTVDHTGRVGGTAGAAIRLGRAATLEAGAGASVDKRAVHPRGRLGVRVVLDRRRG